MVENENGEGSKKQSRDIEFVAPIGGGKTSLALPLSECLKTSMIEEPYGVNPYLEGFYTEDPKEFSFRCQMKFMIMDWECDKKALSQSWTGAVRIKDGGRHQNSIIQTAQYKLGYMSDDDAALYTSYYSIFYQGLPEPDIIIALKAKKETVIEKIIKKGRPMELIMLEKHPEYFLTVVDVFDEWLALAQKTYGNVIVIDTDDPKFNPGNYKESFLQVLEK